jgi:hypothetical protein
VHNLVKVENETTLYKDVVSKVVINKDNTAYENYMQQRARLKAEQEQLKQNTNDIQELKKDIGDIKGMLSIILNSIQK